MRIVVAIDSFKGSLSTLQSGEAVARAAELVFDSPFVDICPLADGGEGTVDAIVAANKGEYRTMRVTGPLGTPVNATYGIVGSTAVIEMSAAAGITLIAPEARDPLRTTTYGVGELIADAIAQGCRKFLIGIGGSATNDGGIGMLQALGFDFLDADGSPVPFGANGLAALAEIRCERADPALLECEFRVACDVTNPLCGERGCSAIYGPQKGATPETVRKMDAWMAKYAALTEQINPAVSAEHPGAGAAGGLGFALLSYLGATLGSGIDTVIEATGLEAKLAAADLVVTGEGRLDGQSAMGKAPVGVARAAKKYGKTVIAFSGCVTPDARACNEHGIDAFFPILRTPCTLEQAMDIENASKNLADTAEQAFRLIRTILK